MRRGEWHEDCLTHGMAAPLLALPAPRLRTRARWWLRQAPGRLGRALPRVAASTLVLSALFWGGYLTGAGKLEAGTLPLTFVRPDGPPGWLRDFSTAFCRGDATYVAAHLGGKYAGVDEAMVQGQFDSLHGSSGDCVAAHYLGTLTGADGAHQYIYVFDFAGAGLRSSAWFVFTTLAERVVNIEGSLRPSSVPSRSGRRRGCPIPPTIRRTCER